MYCKFKARIKGANIRSGQASHLRDQRVVRHGEGEVKLVQKGITFYVFGNLERIVVGVVARRSCDLAVEAGLSQVVPGSLQSHKSC